MSKRRNAHRKNFMWITAKGETLHIHSMDEQHLRNSVNSCLRKAAKEYFASESYVFEDKRTQAGEHFPMPPLSAVLQLFPSFVFLLDEHLTRKEHPGYAKSAEAAYTARMLKDGRDAADPWTEEERELYARRRSKRIPRYRPRRTNPQG